MGSLSRRSFVFATVAFGFYGGSAAAQKEPSGASKRVALKGYDPMSYFTDGKPEKGSTEFTFAFDDTTYWFKSAEHKANFAADPERYAPQFDGYCAVQLSRGRKVEADPEAWAITNGKLYVFSGKGGVPTFQQAAGRYRRKGRRELAETSRRAIARGYKPALLSAATSFARNSGLRSSEPKSVLSKRGSNPRTVRLAARHRLAARLRRKRPPESHSCRHRSCCARASVRACGWRRCCGRRADRRRRR